MHSPPRPAAPCQRLPDSLHEFRPQSPSSYQSRRTHHRRRRPRSSRRSRRARRSASGSFPPEPGCPPMCRQRTHVQHAHRQTGLSRCSSHGRDPILRAADGYGSRWTGPERGRILHAYPELSRDDVVAALDYASAVMDEEVVALGAWRGSTAYRQMLTWPRTPPRPEVNRPTCQAPWEHPPILRTRSPVAASRSLSSPGGMVRTTSACSVPWPVARRMPPATLISSSTWSLAAACWTSAVWSWTWRTCSAARSTSSPPAV